MGSKKKSECILTSSCVIMCSLTSCQPGAYGLASHKSFAFADIHGLDARQPL